MRRPGGPPQAYFFVTDLRGRSWQFYEQR